MTTAQELFADDPTLLGRMYFSYREYYIRKGVNEDDLMSMGEWKEHFGLL